MSVCVRERYITPGGTIVADERFVSHSRQGAAEDLPGTLRSLRNLSSGMSVVLRELSLTQSVNRSAVAAGSGYGRGWQRCTR